MVAVALTSGTSGYVLDNYLSQEARCSRPACLVHFPLALEKRICRPTRETEQLLNMNDPEAAHSTSVHHYSNESSKDHEQVDHQDSLGIVSDLLITQLADPLFLR